MSEAYLRPPVLDGIINLLRHVENYRCTLLEASKYLRSGPYTTATCDYDRAMLVLCELDRVPIDLAVDRKTQLRALLSAILMKYPPPWEAALYLGREHVRDAAHDDTMLSFQYAGLLASPPDHSVEKWWTEIGQFFRSRNDRKLLELGRIGERLSLDREERGLLEAGIDRLPIWKSLEDNNAGYDILSYDWENLTTNERFIEVKACSFPPMHFYISRAEWDFASSHAGTYELHVWLLGPDTLQRLTKEQLEAHVPQDRGDGAWRKLYVTLWA